MKKLDLVARVFVGLIFFVFGLNGFFFFIPMPPPEQIPEPMRNFMGALMSAGYLLPFIKGTEVVAGGLLLINKFSGVALVILAPIILNILAVHTLIDRTPPGSVIALLIAACSVYLGARNWKIYKNLFKSFG